MHSTYLSECGCVNQAFNCSERSGQRSQAGLAAQVAFQDKVTNLRGPKGEEAAPTPTELPLLCCVQEGFRDNAGHSFGETGQCKCKCTHGMEISHLHSPPPREISSSL